MEKKKTVCFISGYSPSSMEGGYFKCSMQYIRFLEKEFNVILFNASEHSLKGRFGFLHKRFKQALSLFTNKSSFEYDFYSNRVVQAFRNMPEADIYVYNHLRAAWLFRYRDKKHKSVYLAHNAEYASAVCVAQLISNPILRKLVKFDSKKVSRLEQDVINHMDLVVALSDEDKRRLEKHQNGVCRVTVCPPEINEWFHFDPQRHLTAEKNLNMIGSFTWHPKYFGAKWFIQNVFAGIKHRNKEVMLSITGRDAKKLSALVVEGIDINSDVKDIKAYYARPGIFVIPEFQESGVKYKTIEAASAGFPIVSTPAGVEGTGLVHGVSCLVCETADEFVDALSELILDQELQVELAHNAQKHIIKTFKEIDAGSALLEAIKSLYDKT
jgi:glycosyltransferase involved in cell wall biosynthesis